jgi:uracil-DNA glycosylase family 4
MADERLFEQIRLRAGYLKDQGLGYAQARARKSSGGQGAGPSSGPSVSAATAKGRVSLEASSGDPGAALDAVKETIGDCRRCRLCEGRNRIVFGVGNPRARIIFVGEGPGADEDRQGIPFVGRAGQLLTDIITKGMGLSRDDVYIANVVKCRPPQNREPQPDEVETCLPFLEAQIEAIKPEVIVGLGKSAVQALLSTPVQITKCRGQWTNFRGIDLMPTFHPSYLLRNRSAKRDVWQDIQQVLARLGMVPPGRS